jgi:lipopolysaccharide transport system ATP-binding protein
MEEVSKNEGRTVLFVSHNVAAIQALSTKGMVLNNGHLTYFGEITNAIQNYSSIMMQKGPDNVIKGRGKHTRLLSIRHVNKVGEVTDNYMSGEPMYIEFEIETDGIDGSSWELILSDQTNQTRIAISSLYQLEGLKMPDKAGVYRYSIELNPLLLSAGYYFFDFGTTLINVSWDHYVERALEFEVPYFDYSEVSSWNFKSSMGFGNFAITCKDIHCKLVNDVVKIAN